MYFFSLRNWTFFPALILPQNTLKRFIILPHQETSLVATGSTASAHTLIWMKNEEFVCADRLTRMNWAEEKCVYSNRLWSIELKWIVRVRGFSVSFSWNCLITYNRINNSLEILIRTNEIISSDFFFTDIRYLLALWKAHYITNARTAIYYGILILTNTVIMFQYSSIATMHWETT